jgi:hypothetical protein
MSSQPQLGQEWPLAKRKNYISPISQEQRNKKSFLIELQKHCGEQGFCRRRQPFQSKKSAGQYSVDG